MKSIQTAPSFVLPLPSLRKASFSGTRINTPVSGIVCEYAGGIEIATVEVLVKLLRKILQ
ncbi:MAG: hypothetical protein OEQ12_02270 [Nitrosopumilus sp.]|nr:hypothetical protein [Nitrosopumilus sp.]